MCGTSGTTTQQMRKDADLDESIVVYIVVTMINKYLLHVMETLTLAGPVIVF